VNTGRDGGVGKRVKFGGRKSGGAHRHHRPRVTQEARRVGQNSVNPVQMAGFESDNATFAANLLYK
jgi:hypothetical protein